MAVATLLAALATAAFGAGLASVGGDAHSAKEFERLVLVGAGGRSIAVRPGPRALDGLFGASPDARPVGGYLKLYLLGPDGLPGVPGRWYPEAGATCLGWDQAREPATGPCSVVRDDLLAAFALARSLPRFFGKPTTLRLIRNARLPATLVQGNLRVAFQLAFDRHRLARRSARPKSCLAFSAAWRGPAARTRPTTFCLGPRGVYVRGRLYPLGRGVWGIAVLNLR